MFNPKRIESEFNDLVRWFSQHKKPPFRSGNSSAMFDDTGGCHPKNDLNWLGFQPPTVKEKHPVLLVDSIKIHWQNVTYHDTHHKPNQLLSSINEISLQPIHSYLSSLVVPVVTQRIANEQPGAAAPTSSPPAIDHGDVSARWAWDVGITLW